MFLFCSNPVNRTLFFHVYNTCKTRNFDVKHVLKTWKLRSLFTGKLARKGGTAQLAWKKWTPFCKIFMFKIPPWTKVGRGVPFYHWVWEIIIFVSYWCNRTYLITLLMILLRGKTPVNKIHIYSNRTDKHILVLL